MDVQSVLERKRSDDYLILQLCLLGFLKMIDTLLGTAKTILVQRNKGILAGIALGLSNFIYLYITKDIVTSDSTASLIIVSIASGVGCYLAIAFNNKFSKEKTYVNVILSDNVEDMKTLRDFLALNKITNIVNDSYDLSWEKTLSITAYAETKEQSRLIDNYLHNSDAKFKRVVQNKRVRR